MVLKGAFFTTLFFILITTACDLLLVPKRDRDNPMDPDNPVAAMQNFEAVAISATEVLITLEAPELEDQTRMPAGFVIIRTQDRFPYGADDPDGLKIEKSIDAATGSIEIRDDGLDPDTHYGYSVWSFGTGDLAGHYTFSGSNGAYTIDPSTDIEVLNHFAAWAYAIDQVYIEWDYSATGLLDPGGVLIVRKEGAEGPSNPDDGTPIIELGNRSSIRDYGLLDNTGYTYGIWPTDEDGTPFIYGQPDPAPRFTVSVTVKSVSVSLKAQEVATIDETDFWDNGPPALAVNSGSTPQSASLIRFDLSDLKDKYIGTIVTANLQLVTQEVVTSGVVEVFRTGEVWGTGYTWNEVTGDGGFYIDDDDAPSAFVDTADGYFTWDIAAYIRQLPAGFILLGNTAAPADVSFYPSGESGPHLILIYYGQP